MPGSEALPKVKEYVEACCRPYFKALEQKIELQMAKIEETLRTEYEERITDLENRLDLLE
jgi:hypothetical protein